MSDNSINLGGFEINTPINDYRLVEIYVNPIRVDQVLSDTVYLGWINNNKHIIDQTQSIWRIKRMQLRNGIWYAEFPNGDTSFNNVWNDRTILNYM